MQQSAKLRTGEKIVILAMLLASPARGQELTAAWFEANYVPAAQKLEKFYGECSAKVLRTVTKSNSDKFSSKTTINFAFDDTKRKFDRTIESTGEDGSGTKWSRTVVASPEVSFMVLTQEGPPLLEQVDRSTMGFAQATSQIDAEASDTIYSPFSVLEWRISEWIKSKTFAVKEVRREGVHVRVDFRYKPLDREYVGWITFLPDRQWVIDHWDITLKRFKPEERSWRIVSDMTYGGDDPVPALTGATATSYHSDRTDSEKIIIEELKFSTAPASEFKLSHYGYDDRIATPASFSKSLWFWLGGAGVLCLLAALALRWLNDRRAMA
jgi:hypothetical protein